ncbi:hypothetical protein LY78DRAFT_657268 [Colletotrichum sublineola]|nr:hypothetical protein LY78DRAFT_657268 [Colletotrichum sublineola]
MPICQLLLLRYCSVAAASVLSGFTLFVRPLSAFLLPQNPSQTSCPSLFALSILS